MATVATINAKRVSSCLKTLGDPTRMLMMKLLSSDDYCVCQFVDMFDMSQPSISQHLKKLKIADYVNEERRGQWRYFSLNTECPEHELIQQILQQIPDSDEVLQQLRCRGENATC
ncbi:ArsR/SmtB family transcription factor [Rossellomorea marisflavi]|uniref:ArsR/SmtB family transcription factor n=1 Tax=Rossellomorea marisflavi TaxID=189381 RepID=UPI003CECA1E0